MNLFSFLFDGAGIVGAMVAALLLSASVLAAFRSSGFGMAWAGVLVLIDALFAEAPYIRLGLQIYPGDLISLTLAAAAAARLIGIKDSPRVPRSWMIFVTVLLISAARGILSFGTAGGQAFRGYFYAIAIASYVMTFPTNDRTLRTGVTAFVYLASIVMLLVIVRWFAVLLNIPALLPEGGRFASSEASELRVIGSEAAIIIADVLLITLFFPNVAPAARKLRPLLPLLGLTIIVLQHRSVWLACLAGIVARFLLPTENKKAGLQLAALLLATVVVAAPIALSGRLDNTSAEVAQSADRALALSDTAQARFQTWQWVFGKWSGGGPLTIATGLPFGTSMERTMLDGRGELVKASFSSHNYFVQTLFVSGILGVGASIYMFSWLVFRLYELSRNPEHATASSLLFVTVSTQIVYYIPYGMHFFQCMLLGIAAAYVQSIRSQVTRLGRDNTADRQVSSLSSQLKPNHSETGT